MRCALLLFTFGLTLVAQDTPEVRQALELSKKAVALDTAQRAAEAEPIHKRAVALAPRSADVLNNYATHLWLSEQHDRALTIYRQLLTIEPSHPTANLMLAQSALEQDKPVEALPYIERLPDAAPQKILLRTEALYKTGNTAQADVDAARLTELSRTDPMMAYSAGIVFSKVRRYEQARRVFAVALLQRPQDVDVLYSLSVVEEASKRPEAAAQSLAKAAKLDPKRADVQKLLAIAMSELNAWDDAAAAWERYLKLSPTDEVAQRESAWTAVIRGDTANGLAGLERYAVRHPRDVVGHYELGQAAKSIEHLNRAIAIDPNYVPARTARGSLFYQEGNAQAALKDLEIAASLRPDDAVNLDRLGQTYLSLERPAEAVQVLRRAVELAPSDAKTWLHLGRAVADTGNLEESKAAMERFRQLSTERRPGVPSGLVDYLAMSPAERRESNKARIEKAVHDHPDDARAQLSALKLQLQDSDRTAAMQTLKRLIALKPDSAMAAETGRALLNAREYVAAKTVLALSKNVELELAIATFYADGVSMAKVEQAIAKGLERPDLQLTAAGFLLRNSKPREALALLNAAAVRLPNDRDILLQRALASEAAGNYDDAESQVTRIENRWPEWSDAWREHATLLNAHNKPEEARKARETAAALSGQ